jgi:alcohol dehydrogenase class IV
VIVRWGLGELPGALAEAGVEKPLVIASPRWDNLALPEGPRWREVPCDRVDEVSSGCARCDGVLAVGGGSAIDLGKAVSAATGLPLVSLPTTYSGAEWTTYFGIRDPERKMRGGGSGAHPTTIVYEPELTMDLPRETTVGTAMNALAHCAEALYVEGHNPAADEQALTGARLISEWLPRVVESPRDFEARRELLRGACSAGAALAGSMLALAHAIAQAIGGATGLPHGTLNGIVLPPVLRFNAQFAPDAVGRFGEAIGAPDDPASRVEELTALGGVTRLRELGVTESGLARFATAAAQRGGNRANPRVATAAEIETILREAW